MNFDLPGQVALVTGAASGIGRALSEALCGLGMVVHMCDVNRPAELEESGGLGAGRYVFHLADMSDAVAVNEVVSIAARDKGQIDYLACCAAIFPARVFLEYSPVEFTRTIEVNLTGPYLCTRAVLPIMRRNDFGRIVTYSSTLAGSGTANGAAYAISKGGVLGFTRGVAQDVESYNIRINCVTPGLTDTPQPRGHLSNEQMAGRASSHPAGRLGRTSDMVDLTLFLFSENGASLNGCEVRSTGGASL